jgi:hypothetical protein
MLWGQARIGYYSCRLSGRHRPHGPFWDCLDMAQWPITWRVHMANRQTISIRVPPHGIGVCSAFTTRTSLLDQAGLPGSAVLGHPFGTVNA